MQIQVYYFVLQYVMLPSTWGGKKKLHTQTASTLPERNITFYYYSLKASLISLRQGTGGGLLQLR
jgi:hypothetical protein